MIKYRIVLVRPTYQGNIGAVARAMMNFGFTDLVIVDPQCEIGLEARQRAMHAYTILAKAKIVRDLSRAIEGTDIVVGTTGTDAKSKRNVNRHSVDPVFFSSMSRRSSGKGALIFGSEADGLLNSELEMCDIILTIPASSRYPILNLSHAVSVILYQLFITTANSDDKKEKMNGKVKKILYEKIDEFLANIDYPAHRRSKVSLQLKRFISKAWPAEQDSEVLLGIIKRTLRELQKHR